jgi:hypothetical protein
MSAMPIYVRGAAIPLTARFRRRCLQPARRRWHHRKEDLNSPPISCRRSTPPLFPVEERVGRHSDPLRRLPLKKSKFMTSPAKARWETVARHARVFRLELAQLGRDARQQHGNAATKIGLGEKLDACLKILCLAPVRPIGGLFNQPVSGRPRPNMWVAEIRLRPWPGLGPPDDGTCAALLLVSQLCDERKRHG